MSWPTLKDFIANTTPTTQSVTLHVQGLKCPYISANVFAHTHKLCWHKSLCSKSFKLPHRRHQSLLHLYRLCSTVILQSQAPGAAHLSHSTLRNSTSASSFNLHCNCNFGMLCFLCNNSKNLQASLSVLHHGWRLLLPSRAALCSQTIPDAIS